MFGDIVPERFQDFILHKDLVTKLKSYTKHNINNLLFCDKKVQEKNYIKWIF